jgi:diguanylate cyclase (GGDEF)-like protein/PAS domain S-box-containing protein
LHSKVIPLCECAESMVTLRKALMGMNEWPYTGEKNGERVSQSLNQINKTREEGAEVESVPWKSRYELVMTASGQVVYEYDVSTGDMTWGFRLEQILGYSPDEMRGGITQWEEMIHPEDREKVLRMLKIAEKNLTPFDAQYRFRHQDGAYRWVHDRGNFITDGHGKAIRMIGMMQDITAHRRVEKELQESEARYHSLFKKNQAAMLMIDPETAAVIDANLGACVFYGYPYEKIIKLKMTDIDILTTEEVKAEMQRVLSEQENHCYGRHRLANGQVRDVEVYSGPLFMRGRLLLYSIIHDITERKQAEEALRQSEEKYRTILESIEEGYCEVDLVGNFTFFNDSMCRIFGYPKEELMGMNNRQYTDQENAKKLYRAFQQVYRTGEPRRGYEYEIIRKDGSKRYVETSASLRKDTSGDPIGFRGIVRDVTERKRFERILQQERETFFSILQKEPYGALLINTDGTFLYVNPEFTAITGYTIKDVPTGKEWFRKAYPDPEYRHKIIAVWKEDIIPRKGGDRVWSVVCKDGQVKEIEFKLTILDDGRVIVMLSDVTERKRTEEELAYKATHDLLTGLPNRILFKDRFSVAVAQAQRVHKKLAVMFLDLNRFKEINDTLGHDAGDGLLCAVSNRLTNHVRKADTVARMGGDEFLLLLPDIDRVKDVIAIAKKVLQGFREPFVVGDHKISINTSIGIAIYPDDGEDVDTLVSYADKAMYDDKHRGHNICSSFPQNVTSETRN